MRALYALAITIGSLVATGPAGHISGLATAGQINVESAFSLDKFSVNLYQWPVDAPIQVLKPFSLGVEPWLGGHTGIDVRAGTGSTIRSPANATVWFAGYVAGRKVLTLEIDGFLLSFDAVEPFVKTGDQIRAGEAVAATVDYHCGKNCFHIGLRIQGDYLNPLLLFRSLPYSVVYSSHTEIKLWDELVENSF